MSSTSLNNKNINVEISEKTKNVDKRNLIVFSSWDRSVMVYQYNQEEETKQSSSQPLLTLKGHTDEVNCVCFNPNKSLIASSSGSLFGADGSVRVWQTSSGKCLQVFRDHSDWVYAVSWSPDGSRLASSSDDESIRIYDTKSSIDPKEWHCLHHLQGHSYIVRSVAWSMDSCTLASASWDKTVRVWNMKSYPPDCSHILKHHTNDVNCVSFSPNGLQLASCSDDKTIAIYDTKNYVCINTLQSTESIYCVSWSPDSTKLAHDGPNNEVWVWDMKSSPNTCIHKLKGHTDWIKSVDWNEDGTRLVSGSCDKAVRVWDVKKEQCISTLVGHSDWVRSVAWRSPSEYYHNYEVKKMFLLAVESAWNSKDEESKENLKKDIDDKELKNNLMNDYIINKPVDISEKSQFCILSINCHTLISKWELQRKINKSKVDQIVKEMSKYYEKHNDFFFTDPIHIVHTTEQSVSKYNYNEDDDENQNLIPIYRYYIIDGQHRFEAYKKLFRTTLCYKFNFPAIIHSVGDENEFIKIFDLINKRIVVNSKE